MRAFVVRPFGTKEGVDFEHVHEVLIAEALKAVGVAGDTTAEIAQAGNIRADMFERLATADLVIADISIHNANVFYELGVRHALRARRTFLIRADLAAVPFDLLTDRYLVYRAGEPAAALGALARGLRATLDADADDSPVFTLLRLQQGLVPAELARLLAPPDEFREDVFRAQSAGRAGDLGLLGDDAQRLPWAREGLRRVGNAQFALASHEPARVTWERVRAFDPGDLEANNRLATVYQKLGDLARADEAIDRVLQNPDVLGPERAEAGALRASNHKRRWEREWAAAPDEQARGRAALRSAWGARAYAAYADAFRDDRNHFYSGLNALGLLTALLALSERDAGVWPALFGEHEDAAAARRHFDGVRARLAVGLDLALESAQRAADFRRTPDVWLALSRAERALLNRLPPERVAAEYRRALSGAERLHADTAERQLVLYRRLGVLAEGSAAALEALTESAAQLPPDDAGPRAPARVLLFTGHRIDAPGRDRPRFPAAAEALARRLIAEAVDRERGAAGGDVVGLAGGASGGDLLFHEVCAERGIPTELYIVSGRDAYVAASVEDAGPAWVARFDALRRALPTRVLGDSDHPMSLPRWLRPARDYSVWQRANRWMLHNALVYGSDKVTLLALWDGAGGDGLGGTQDLVETARGRGARVVVVDAGPLAASDGPGTS